MSLALLPVQKGGIMTENQLQIIKAAVRLAESIYLKPNQTEHEQKLCQVVNEALENGDLAGVVL